MDSRDLPASPQRWTTRQHLFLMCATAGLTLLLAGCPTPPRRGPDAPPGTGGTGPKSACAGSFPIGVLAVISDIVFRNGSQARNGERVCNGDHISTNATGVGDLLLDGDHASDSIHFAEGTDPSVTLTPNGCVTIDAYRSGRVIATARRRCMVLRTPDTLLLLVGGSAQVHVFPNKSTEVVPLRGTLIKLINFPPQKVNVTSQAELTRFAASAGLQPQPQSLNVYTRNQLVGPAIRLSPSQIQQIDRSLLRRPGVPLSPSNQQIR